MTLGPGELEIGRDADVTAGSTNSRCAISALSSTNNGKSKKSAAIWSKCAIFRALWQF
jgi:hypothetical protein